MEQPHSPAVLLTNLKRLLECRICLEIYKDPKLLVCGHHLCKECIECILTFKEDGSAVVECPLRCEKRTTIKGTEVVSDLVPSYDFRCIHDAFQSAGGLQLAGAFQCKQSTQCNKEITMYCCQMLMCKGCYTKHVTSETHQCEISYRSRTGKPSVSGNMAGGKSGVSGATATGKLSVNGVPLVYNHQLNELEVLCEEHRCGCTMVCEQDGSFLCQYCVHRSAEHKTHDKRTVSDKVRLLKEVLKNQLSKIEKIQMFGAETRKRIDELRTKLFEVLKLRKDEALLLCGFGVSCLKKKLDAEELRLKENFEHVCEEHLNEVHKIKFPSQKYQSLLKKTNSFELLLQKTHILEVVRNNKVPSSLKSVLLTLNTPEESPKKLASFCATPHGEISVGGAVASSTLIFDGSEDKELDAAKKRVKNLTKAQKRREGNRKKGNSKSSLVAQDVEKFLKAASKTDDLEDEFERINPDIAALSLTVYDRVPCVVFGPRDKESRLTELVFYDHDGVTKVNVSCSVDVLFPLHHAPSAYFGTSCGHCGKPISRNVNLYRFTPYNDMKGCELLCYRNNGCGHFITSYDWLLCDQLITRHYALKFGSFWQIGSFCQRVVVPFLIAIRYVFGKIFSMSGLSLFVFCIYISRLKFLFFTIAALIVLKTSFIVADTKASKNAAVCLQVFVVVMFTLEIMLTVARGN